MITVSFKIDNKEIDETPHDIAKAVRQVLSAPLHIESNNNICYDWYERLEIHEGKTREL